MLMGVETEYGILDGWSAEKAEAIQAEVLKGRRHLGAIKSGVFLENGARVYVDNGKQNEYATPETESPSDLVVRELAGRRLMAEAARGAGLSLLCTQVDPVWGTSWGSHENYECARQLRTPDLSRLYPHLVTRLVYAGAGGLDPTCPGVRPVLSPRASLLHASYSVQGVPRKALVFAKPEPYCEGARLHLMCGESLLCHTASFLKYATTALVARCLDVGARIGPGPLAVSALRALRTVNRDLSLSAKLPLAGGGRLTALEIQEHYLAGVEASLGRLPEWAPLAVRRWGRTLQDLKAGAPGCASRFDWLRYRNLFGELAEECGFGPAEIERLNGAARRGGAASESFRFRQLRAAGHALYVKLHVLGDGSLFERLADETEGGHRLEEVTDEAVRLAVSDPPPGRAANRAALIRAHAAEGGYHLSWNLAAELTSGRRLEIPRVSGWRAPVRGKEDACGFADVCGTAARGR